MNQTVDALPDLYEADETAWLEAMAELISQGKHAELDYTHLQEYLTDMARRDKREVKSRLRLLLAHLLKWTQQAEKRTASWRRTIDSQREDLTDLFESRVLRNHADSILSGVYPKAVEDAVVETSLQETDFPRKCPWTIEMLLSEDVLGE